MPFPESFLQELCTRNEISDVVSGYVKLNKRSGANLFGLCPFHSEKTPSFSVSSDKQIYHCFGCGKGGGVINFIMEVENLSYPDAVRFLARRVGMAVPEEERDEFYSQRERMLSLNKDAARFFYEQLSGPGGQAARDYVQKREISPAMARCFGLGFAPNAWGELTDAMHKKGYTKPELLAAGLARASKKGDGGIYDTFRNRLMFPVIDVRGSVIGFSGRILDDGEPKYMNSPETLVFNKSRNLFALNLAKKSKKGYIILSEGNVDVVALHQAGFDCAVASLGTSLTPEQARLLTRYTDQVIIAYDGDAAGQKASQRAIGILEKLDLKVKVLKITGAKDPDEYIKKFGAAAFENMLSRSENHVEYRLSELAGGFDITGDEGKVAYLREATAMIAGLPGAVEREIYARRVGQLTGVSDGAVIQEVERARKRLLGSAKKEREKKEHSPARAQQPRERALRFENIRSATAEKGVLSLLYYEPELFGEKTAISGEEFSSPVLGKLFEVLIEKTKLGPEPSLASMAEYFTGDEMSLLTQIVSQPQELSNAQRALADYIDIIKTERLARQPEGDAAAQLKAMAEKMRQSKGYGG